LSTSGAKHTKNSSRGKIIELDFSSTPNEKYSSKMDSFRENKEDNLDQGPQIMKS